MNKKQIRILCVDDHAFLADGLRTRFELESDLTVVGWLSSPENLISEARKLRPDIVLLDIEMPGPDPFETAGELHRQHPDTKVVIFSAYVRDHYITSAFEAGAWGYFSKSDDTNTIIEGLRTISRGEFAFGPAVLERCQQVPGGGRGKSNGRNVTPPSSKLEGLTAREREVLRLIGRGCARSEIASILCRSPKTIDGHRESIMEKLGIHDRGELVRFAIREGLVEA